MEFIRFAGTINTHEEKKVAKATVNVILENCTGTFYIRALKNFHFFLSGSFSFIFFQFFFRKSTKKLWLTP